MTQEPLPEYPIQRVVQKLHDQWGNCGLYYQGRIAQGSFVQLCRTGQLIDEHNALQSQLSAALKRCEILERALEFYANGNNYLEPTLETTHAEGFVGKAIPHGKSVIEREGWGKQAKAAIAAYREYMDSINKERV